MQGSNQRVRSFIQVTTSSGEKMALPQGAYVKAIKKCYLPRDHEFGDYDEKMYTAAYSQHGMVLIPRKELDWYL